MEISPMVGFRLIMYPGLADERGHRDEFGDEIGNDVARRSTAVELDRQGEQMLVEPFPDHFERPLADVHLHQVDGEFQQPGQGDRADVQGTVSEQGGDVLHADGFVDDPLLHLQRQHPHGHGNHDDSDHHELERNIFIKNPRI